MRSKTIKCSTSDRYWCAIQWYGYQSDSYRNTLVEQTPLDPHPGFQDPMAQPQVHNHTYPAHIFFDIPFPALSSNLVLSWQKNAESFVLNTGSRIPSVGLSTWQGNLELSAMPSMLLLWLFWLLWFSLNSLYRESFAILFIVLFQSFLALYVVIQIFLFYLGII